MLFVAESINFSELNSSNTSNLDFGEAHEDFDIGDNGKYSEDIFSKIQADILLFNLLCGLDDRQKIILLYQIVRDSGYGLRHEDCAKTLSLTREHYMFLLKGIKEKAKKIIQQEST